MRLAAASVQFTVPRWWSTCKPALIPISPAAGIRKAVRIFHFGFPHELKYPRWQTTEHILMSVSLPWAKDVRFCWFSMWLPVWFRHILPGSDSGNKRVTSKLCFISSRLQSKSMNTRSQGTKTEIDDDLSSFYVSAVVELLSELIKIHWSVLTPWMLTGKWHSSPEYFTCSHFSAMLERTFHPLLISSVPCYRTFELILELELFGPALVPRHRDWACSSPAENHHCQLSCSWLLWVWCAGRLYFSLFPVLSDARHLFFHLWNQAGWRHTAGQVPVICCLAPPSIPLVSGPAVSQHSPA